MPSRPTIVRRSHLTSKLMLLIGLLSFLSLAAYSWMLQQQVDRVVIAVRPIPYGRQITGEDLGTIEVPRHRPVQITGISDPEAVIGRWAANNLRSNDLLQPDDLLTSAPDHPVYPNGRVLDTNMVSLPFSVATLGPITDRDVVNIGYSDPDGDPALCQQLGGQHGINPAPSAGDTTGQLGRPYACRILSKVPVLYIQEEIAYLQVTPYQAHAIWALQAQGLQLWGERYGTTSDPLTALTRLDASQIEAATLIAPTTTLRLDRRVYDIPGSAAIPGGYQQSESSDSSR